MYEHLRQEANGMDEWASERSSLGRARTSGRSWVMFLAFKVGGLLGERRNAKTVLSD